MSTVTVLLVQIILFLTISSGIVEFRPQNNVIFAKSTFLKFGVHFACEYLKNILLKVQSIQILSSCIYFAEHFAKCHVQQQHILLNLMYSWCNPL